MKYLNIFEKIKVLFEIIIDYKIVLFLVLGLIFISILYFSKKINRQKYFIYIIIDVIISFLISILFNFKLLTNTFDDFMTILFKNIYFPSIYFYIAMLIASFVLFIGSIFNVMLKRIYKVINSVMFILNNILFIIIINIIAKDKLEIFSVTSLYTNTNMVVVLELSVILFTFWMLALVTTYTTSIIYDRLTTEKKVVNENDISEEINNELIEIDANDVIDEAEPVYDITENKLPIIEEVSTPITINPSFDVKTNKETENKFIFLKEETSDKDTQKETIKSTNEINLDINPTFYDNSSELSKYKAPFVHKEVDLNKLIEDTINTSLFDDNILDVGESKEEKIKPAKEELLSLEDNINYSIDDYKKMAEMLKTLKSYSHSKNIKLEDAMALSLINNYSIEDCIKFKNILSNNFN